MYAHPTTVSGIVDRLVERGAVRRETDGSDRRGVRLSLTRLGHRLLSRSPSPVQHGLQQALVALPSARRRELRRSLEEIVRHTEAARVRAPFFDPPS
jgi:DNA-binding MarR family transcriptional regulator